MLDHVSILLLFVTMATIRIHIVDGIKSNQTVFDVYLTLNPPYVWQRTNGKEDGTVPQLLRVVESECEEFKLKIKTVSWSSEELNQILRSNDPTKSLNEKLKKGSNGDDTFTADSQNNNNSNITNIKNIIIGASSTQLSEKQRKKFTSFSVAHSNGLAGIVHRETIGIGIKLFHAMCDSMLILYNGFLLSVIFGVLIWWIVSAINILAIPWFSKCLLSYCFLILINFLEMKIKQTEN